MRVSGGIAEERDFESVAGSAGIQTTSQEPGDGYHIHGSVAVNSTQRQS